MSQRILLVVDTMYRKIVSSIDHVNQAKKELARKKSIKSVAKSIDDYCVLMIGAIANKDLGFDPYGIVYKKGISEPWVKDLISKSLDDIRKSDPEIFSSVDIVMTKAVNDNILHKWRTILSNGVKLIVDNKGIKIVSGWFSDTIQWSKEVVNDFIAWLKKQYHNLFDHKVDNVVPTNA